MMVIPVEGFPFSYEERQWDVGKRDAAWVDIVEVFK